MTGRVVRARLGGMRSIPRSRVDPRALAVVLKRLGLNRMIGWGSEYRQEPHPVQSAGTSRGGVGLLGVSGICASPLPFGTAEASSPPCTHSRASWFNARGPASPLKIREPVNRVHQGDEALVDATS